VRVEHFCPLRQDQVVSIGPFLNRDQDRSWSEVLPTQCFGGPGLKDFKFIIAVHLWIKEFRLAGFYDT